jgi:hypothetical protein
METSLDFVTWLSKKLYEINVGFYLTVGLIMTLPALFALSGIPAFIARFIAFFIVCFLRAAYESVIVYETPLKKLSLPKMLLLSFVTASCLSLVAHFLRPRIGDFSIPLSFIISMRVVGKLKAELWPTHERPGFLALLPAKLQLLTWARYGFFLLLVGISYLAYGRLDINFIYAFTAAFFVGMIFEELYSTTKIYEQPISKKLLFATVVWSIICAVGATAIVILADYLGASNQAATIIGVIIVKLIQPLGSRKFMLGC